MALLKTQEEAEDLAEIMIQIGERNGRETVALLTDMDTPLGYGIGNLIEVQEAYRTMGQGPADLTEICLVLSAEMLKLAGHGSYEVCYKAAQSAIPPVQPRKIHRTGSKPGWRHLGVK